MLSRIVQDLARSRPHALALTEGQRSLTYAELEARVSTLSEEFKAMGLLPGSSATLMFEPSIEYVATLLAVWRCKGVAVPLSHRISSTQKVDLIKQIGPSLVLSDERPGSNFPRALEGPRQQTIFEHDHAYLLPTSGSTGDPKLILGSHRALHHFWTWQRREFGLNSESKLSFLSPLSSDVHLRDVGTTLAAGGCVCIPPYGWQREPRLLLDWIEEEGITACHMVPTLFRVLCASLKEHRLETLQHLFLAGESLYGRDVAAWREKLGEHVQLVNLYGPSETTLAKFFFPIPADSRWRSEEVIPLGRPIPETELLLRERSRDEAEILISTPFASHGYHERSDLTKSSFLALEGKVFYCTGDLGFKGEDGLLRFQGRIDSVVKRAGHKVNLQSLEALTLSHSSVKAVAAIQSEGLIRVLVVAKKPEAVSVRELTSFLSERLPVSQLPDRIELLSDIPLTHSGKLDRRRLARQSVGRPENAPAIAGPNTTIRRLEKIWCEVLQLDRVGASDNLFDLGGTSMTVALLAVRIAEEWGRDLSALTLYEYPKIQSLARYLDGNADKIPGSYKTIERARSRRRARTHDRCKSET